MPIDYKNARKLCTASELALLDQAKPAVLSKLKPAEIRKLASSARSLADKWREQAIKQQRATDGSAQRSQQKHAFFKEALSRFEAQLIKLTSPPPAKKAAAKKAAAKKSPIKKKVAKKATSKRPLPLTHQAKKKAIATRMRIERSGQSSRIRGHVSAAGRRNQAARSARKRS